jgi:adenine-specific DNA methylase
MEKYFTKIAGIQMDLLQLSDVGKYSVSKPTDAAEINRIIMDYFQNPASVVITDATANNGGNTIRFALDFRRVNSVEIDTEQYDILQNNVQVYKLSNVKLYNQDYLDMIPKLHQDVVFIDAPWGGPGYKNKPKVDLYLGRRNIVSVVEELIRDAKCKLCVLKVPINYNYSNLFSKLPRSKITVYTVSNYVIMCIVAANTGMGI